MHSRNYLASYVPKTLVDPHPYFTVAGILTYLAEVNSGVPMTTGTTYLNRW